MKNVAYFFKDIGVAGLSSGNIKRIMEAGFDSIPKILAMSKDDFLTVEGFKEKLATKIHTNIENAIDKASLVLIMNASNIFGRGLGLKKIQPIMAKYPDILTSDDSDDEKIEQISEIKGMGEITAKEFVSNISEFLTFINEAGLDDKLDETTKIKDVDTSHVLYGKKLVITGFRDKNLQKQLEKIGAKVGSNVSKKTFIVLVKTIDDDTGKADKARNLGVTLMTPEKFTTKFKL